MDERDLSGSTLGEYVLCELIRKGGYGAVYRGEQPLLEREVVVKVLRAQRTDNDSRERFLREAKLAAQLDHLYAAHVYGFGAEDQGDVLWIAMERVRGVPLDAWLNTHGPMSPEQFGPFFEAVCDVVHAAHELGIVHRDLKPSNIMVIENKGILLPKLLDFGIAKWNRPSEVAPEPGTEEDRDSGRDDVKTTRMPVRPRRAGRVVNLDDSELRRQLTPPNGCLGSPPYMAPEQRYGADGVGPAADIYALGVVAYEMLTKRLPFAADRTDTHEPHQSAPVPRLGDSFPPLLDRVIRCALDKNPRARHSSALELAEDLRRALRASIREQLRISAQLWREKCGPSGLLWGADVLEDALRSVPRETLGPLECSFIAESERKIRRTRWVRRLLVAFATVVAIGGFLYRAAMQARLAEEVSEAAVTQAELEQGRSAVLHNDMVGAQQHLGEAWRRGERSAATAFMYARALQPLRSELARLQTASGRMWSAVFSPDGEQIVTTDDAGAQIWNAANFQTLSPLPHGDAVYSAAYTRDGALVTACGDGAVRIWDPAKGRLVRKLRLRDLAPRWYLVVTGGDRVAAIDGDGANAAVWNITTGAILAKLRLRGSKFPSIALSPDGSRLAVSAGDDVSLVDVGSSATSATLLGPRVRALAWDPTGSHLLIGNASGEASVWSPRGGRLALREIAEAVSAVAFSPDGRLAAVAGDDGTEQVSDATTGRIVTQCNYLHARIASLEFDATGQHLAAAGASGELAITNTRNGMLITVLDGPSQQLRVARFDPSSQRVVAASWDGTARIWDARSPYRRWDAAPISTGYGLFGGVAPDGRFLAITCPGCDTRVWDTADGRLLAALPEVVAPGDDAPVPFPVVSAAGDRAALARGKAAELYELPGGKLLRSVGHAAAVTAVAFGANGELVSGDAAGAVLVTPPSEEPFALPSSGAGIDALVTLPGGRLAAADADGRVRVFDRGVVTAELNAGIRARTLRPSPDGQYLLVVPSHLGRAAFPVLFGHEPSTAKLDAPQVYTARWVDDGHAILTTHADGAARLWSPDGTLRQTYRGGPRFLADADMSPDRSMIVGGGGDGLLRFWDAATGRPLWTLAAHKPYVMGLHFEAADIVTRGIGGELARWHLPASSDVIGPARS